jgi:hypothetical protein
MYLRAILVVVLIACAGCTASMEKYAEAIGKDPANICVSVSTPYGGGVVGRVNTPGAKMNISGGQCTLEVAPEVVK